MIGNCLMIYKKVKIFVPWSNIGEIQFKRFVDLIEAENFTSNENIKIKLENYLHKASFLLLRLLGGI